MELGYYDRQEQRIGSEYNSKTLADSVMTMLRLKDWKKLSSIVHLNYGVRFPPYAYVDIMHDMVFSRYKIAKIDSDTTVYYWGSYNGTGFPIKLTFEVYYGKFISNKNFHTMRAGTMDQQIGKGDTISNNMDIYFGREVAFIEYYISGTEKYSGMDWNSSALSSNAWLLYGI